MDTDPFAAMTDEQVLALSQAHLRAEASLPPDSSARITEAQRFDRCKAELDRRMLDHMLQRLTEMGVQPGDP